MSEQLEIEFENQGVEYHVKSVKESKILKILE